jgi:hypothetical protein
LGLARYLQVQRYALFAGVEISEESAILRAGAAAQERLRPSGGVPRSRWLDLDDLRA